MRDPGPLVGRAQEAALIEHTLTTAGSDRLRILVFEGEPGIGKTRLLTYSMVVARDRGWHVAAVRGAEFERELPLVAMRDGLGLRLEQLAELLPQSTDVLTFSGELPHHLVDALVDVVEERALERPLLLAVDDMQWLDAASVTVLSVVARRLADLPIAVVVTVRTGAAPQQVVSLLDRWRSAGTDHVRLSGLAPDATTELAHTLLGRSPEPDLSRMLAGAAGNPFYLTELLRTVAADQLGGVTVPPSLRLTLLGRLAILPEPTVDLLRAAALLGRGFEVDDLVVVARLDATEIVARLRPAIDAGVLEGDGDGLAFRHDLARDALYEDQPEAVRRVQHREAGRALAAVGADAGKVAAQLLRGARPGDEEAIGALRLAATSELATAPDVAVKHLEQALGLTVPGPSRRDVVADLFRALLVAGRPGDVVERAPHLVAPLAQDPGGARVWRYVARALHLRGQLPEALQVMQTLLGLAPDRRRRVHALSEMALTATLADHAADAAEADKLTQEALAATQEADDVAARSVALAALSRVKWREGRLLEAADLASQSWLAAAQSPSPAPSPLVLMAHPLIDADRFDEARLYIMESQARSAGGALDSPFALFVLGVLEFAIGDWEQATACFEATIESLDDRHLTSNRVAAAAIVASMAVHRGDLVRAEARLETTASDVANSYAGEMGGTISFHLARAELAEARGDPDGALAGLAPAIDHLVACGLLPWCRVAALAFARLAAQLGCRELARPVADAMALMAQRSPVPSIIGLAAACRGLVDDDPAALDQAVVAFEQSARRFEHAQVLELAATAGAADRQVVAARLEAALVRYAEVGATHDEARVDASLRRLGVRRGSRRSHRRVRTGWGSLTEAELRVVALVCDGLGSRHIGERLFISRRTVDSHLAHVFTKLDINSRAELAARAAVRLDREA